MDNTSPIIESNGITRVQQIVGNLLNYGCAMDNTMFVALMSLAVAQTKITDETALALTKLINYACTHPNATLRYVASNMILHIYSDASYVSETKSCSRVNGLFTLTSRAANTTKPPIATPTPNGAINTISNIMRNVMSSATKSEAGGLFQNSKDGVMIRITLAKMGHPQLATPTQKDNSNTTGTANGNVKQRKSKAMDMQFYWVQDRVRQKRFIVYWSPGEQSIADYFTKHFTTAHHQQIRLQYLHVTAKKIIISPFPSMRAHASVTERVCSSSSGLLPYNGPVFSNCTATNQQ